MEHYFCDFHNGLLTHSKESAIAQAHFNVTGSAAKSVSIVFWATKIDGHFGPTSSAFVIIGHQTFFHGPLDAAFISSCNLYDIEVVGKRVLD